MSQEPHTLSLRHTFFNKVVFPIGWIGGFAGFTWSLFLSPESWKDANGDPPEAMKWILLGITLAGTAVIRWVFIPIKRVRMDDDSLYISNYLKEIVIPLANVEEVTENFWTDGPVTIRFRSDTSFGSRVTFLPKFRWFDFSPHPVVEEIRAAVRRATGLEPR